MNLRLSCPSLPVAFTKKQKTESHDYEKHPLNFAEPQLQQAVWM